jgi:hypothetical protein
MEIERAREILKGRRFWYNEDGYEEMDDMTFELYERSEDDAIIELCYSANKVIGAFISNPYYNFGTDEQDRRGINLGDNYDYKINEELFTYCLDIQENPGLHEINFVRGYLGFSEWRNKELMPVIKHLGLGELLEDVGNEVEDDYFRLQTSFAFEDDHDFLIEVEIDPLTINVSITISKYGLRREDLSVLYESPSDVILAAIEEYMDGSKKR